MQRLAKAFKRFPKLPGTYIVGGPIRDVLLDRTPADYDMVVLDHPYKFAADLARKQRGRLVEMGKADQRIYRVVFDGIIVDVSPPAGTSIEQDLARRDFTINALAYDLYAEKLIDISGGMKDLSGQIIRMVSETAFEADPLRLIRAYRIGAQLRFAIDPFTASAIRRHAPKIRIPAGERVCHEFFRMLHSADARIYLSGMSDNGLLFAIFPELTALRGCAPTRHHHYDAWEHTLKAFYDLENMLNEPQPAFSEMAQKISGHLDREGSALLKWSILLHDIGKPSTRSLGSDGSVHYYGHCQKGAELVDAICRRLKMSNRMADYLGFVVRHHLRPLMLFTAHTEGRLTPRGTNRFFIRCGNFTPDILVHAMADASGKTEGKDKKSAAFFEFANGLLASFFQQFRPAVTAPPLITGRDLIAEFNLPPSPLFKTILARVEENRLSGDIQSKGAALRYVEDYLGKKDDY